LSQSGSRPQHEVERHAAGGSGSNAGFGVMIDCQTCGACCAYSHDWPELGDDPDGNDIPIDLIDCDVGRMKCDGDRCIALKGVIGVSVSCSVYAVRPAVCREFDPTKRMRDCNLVRAWHGLPPMTPNQ
jgi:Fe-S-cluster containining protein